MAKVVINHHKSNDEVAKFLEGTAASFTYMVFGLLDNSESLSSPESLPEFDVEDHENAGEEIVYNLDEDKEFWETQEQLLQATVCRTSSLETKIRQATKDALMEINSAGGDGVRCICHVPVTGSCRSCLQREISIRLQNIGFDCSVCKSKWRSSPGIPSGEHTYLEVVDKSKKCEIRVVIELNFRAEFEIARASDDYQRLIRRLPEVFIGKSERLRNLIKILCGATKKCMKDKKVHLGPWRKHKYMQAKWFGTCERVTIVRPLPVRSSSDPRKPRESMLKFDFTEKSHCAAVAV
ncbi:hypothetical protein ACFE04_018144 [Oxalis oulophora]